jgi:hypothetical protein
MIVDTVVVGWKIRGFFSVRTGGTIFMMCQETGNLRHYTVFDMSNAIEVQNVIYSANNNHELFLNPKVNNSSSNHHCQPIPCLHSCGTS